MYVDYFTAALRSPNQRGESRLQITAEISCHHDPYHYPKKVLKSRFRSILRLTLSACLEAEYTLCAHYRRN